MHRRPWTPALLVWLVLAVVPSADASGKSEHVYAHRGDTALTLDLYLPATPPPVSGYPLIISIHGGGWLFGSRKNDVFLLPLVKDGYALASMDYRLSNRAKYPAQIEDVRESALWLVRNAKRLHLDPNRIAVTGASAGAHLALLLAFSQDTRLVRGGSAPLPRHAIKAVVAFYPPTDLVSIVPKERRDKAGNLVAALLGGPINQHLAAARHGSPINYVSANVPPVLLIHGTADHVVPFDQSTSLQKAMEKAGASVQLITYQSAGHAFRPRPQTTREIRRFLDKYLNPPALTR